MASRNIHQQLDSGTFQAMMTGTGPATGTNDLLVNGYESIPINTIFRGMNIHLPVILM